VACLTENIKCKDTELHCAAAIRHTLEFLGLLLLLINKERELLLISCI